MSKGCFKFSSKKIYFVKHMTLKKSLMENFIFVVCDNKQALAKTTNEVGLVDRGKNLVGEC